MSNYKNDFCRNNKKVKIKKIKKITKKYWPYFDFGIN